MAIHFCPKYSNKILRIISDHECVYGTYGIHPHEAKKHLSIDTKKIIDNTSKNKKIIGIGETGLDFYYNHSDSKDQIFCFEKHIEAAQITKLPLIVHTRNAEKETLEILKKNKLKKDFKVLLTHDPSHWDAEVLKHNHKFHLTLSGHTHGFQFGIEIPGFLKWSPSQWQYKQWAGIYEKNTTNK